MSGKKVTALWLVPAAPENQLFSALIRILARELKAPLFEPHITLSLSATPPADAGRFLKELRSAPILLSVGGVSYSGRFTKTLFVRFRTNPRLNDLLKKLKVGRRIPRLTDPHLSLCYKKLSAAAKRELASIIKLPFKSVRFDVVKAVACISPTTDARDVRAWRTIGTRILRD
jgi:Cyclic phosphodiesterase-like protein